MSSPAVQAYSGFSLYEICHQIVITGPSRSRFFYCPAKAPASDVYCHAEPHRSRFMKTVSDLNPGWSWDKYFYYCGRPLSTVDLVKPSAWPFDTSPIPGLGQTPQGGLSLAQRAPLRDDDSWPTPLDVYHSSWGEDRGEILTRAYEAAYRELANRDVDWRYPMRSASGSSSNATFGSSTDDLGWQKARHDSSTAYQDSQKHEHSESTGGRPKAPQSNSQDETVSNHKDAEPDAFDVDRQFTWNYGKGNGHGIVALLDDWERALHTKLFTQATLWGKGPDPCAEEAGVLRAIQYLEKVREWTETVDLGRYQLSLSRVLELYGLYGWWTEVVDPGAKEPAVVVARRHSI